MQRILAKGPKAVILLVDAVYALLYIVYSAFVGFSIPEGNNIITEIIATILNFIISIPQWILSNLLLGRFLFSSSVIVILILCNFFMFIFPKIWANRHTIMEKTKKLSMSLQEQRSTVEQQQNTQSVVSEPIVYQQVQQNSNEGQMNLF